MAGSSAEIRISTRGGKPVAVDKHDSYNNSEISDGEWAFLLHPWRIPGEPKLHYVVKFFSPRCLKPENIVVLQIRACTTHVGEWAVLNAESLFRVR